MRKQGIKLVIAVAALAISGCATTAKYEAVLNSWLGSHAQDLVNSWGYPDGSFKAPNGNEVYVYARGANVTMPSQYHTTGTVNSLGGYSTFNATTTQSGGQTLNFWCKTYIEMNQSKRIVNWRWEGNNCIAR